MWCLLLLILYVSSSSGQSIGDDDTRNSSYCVLPPQPKNGRYEIIEAEGSNVAPGTKLAKFIIQFSCDPGFHLTADAKVPCLGGRYPQEKTECLPHCTIPSSDIISCGLGDGAQESRCIMPQQIKDTFSLRSKLLGKGLDCGSTGPQYAEIIVGGRTAKKQEMPWHAGVYTKQTQPYKQICGGSLVSETVVISAAHCFWTDVAKQLPATHYAVAVGKVYRPWDEPHDEHAQKSDVAEIKLPPRFHGDTTRLQDDIALVVVSTPFTFTSTVIPVCLDFDTKFDSRQLTPGNLGKVAGWGLTSEDGRQSPVLQVVEMPVVGIDECIEKFDPSFKSHITSDKICAGYQNGTSVCKGDSGGGLSFPESIRGVTRYFLRGVVSAAPSTNLQCNILARGTFTHVQKHEQFIREKMPQTSSAPATVEQLSPGLEPAFL